ncbi:MAG: hypothetical protein B6I24_04850 [Bacteroidetes bacterium 4572_128]|nr:MAG: hypothetical protein B6I24_04850 [Bacteroidetes bacterium 4572_128]
MKKIYESQFLNIFYEEDISLMTEIFTEETENITDEKYKKMMLNILECIKKYKPIKLIVDLKNFIFIIVPELQEWQDKNIVPEISKCSAKIAAYIVSKDFFSQMSIEQTVEEEESEKNFTVKYFEDIKKARKWILKK